MITVTGHREPYCIHPYEIDTSENDVIKDPANNSIYFHINENEFNTREKRSQLNSTFNFHNFFL